MFLKTCSPPDLYIMTLVAGSQILFSNGLGVGSIIYLATGNAKKHNCIRDAFLVCIINSVSSILGAMTVFSLLGVLASYSGQNIEDVSQGIELKRFFKHRTLGQKGEFCKKNPSQTNQIRVVVFNVPQLTQASFFTRKIQCCKLFFFYICNAETVQSLSKVHMF